MSDKKIINPFQNNPEEVLQERMKRARKITRDEFFKQTSKQPARKKSVKK